MKYTYLLGVLAVAGIAAAQDAGPKFEVASIKPNHSGDRRAGIAMEPGGRFVANNVAAKMLITMAYQLKSNQISGLPSWADSDRFDITAKPESGKGIRSEDIRAMVRNMLEERFQLKFHKETKELPIYALVVAKNGPKLKASTGNADIDSDEADRRAAPPEGGRGRGPGRQGVRMSRGELNAANVTVGMLADQLSSILGRNVIDKTGLNGNYDFILKYTPDLAQAPPSAGGSTEPPPPNDQPSIFEAVQEQLGLKLESQKGPVDIYVIERLEKPSEN